MGKETTTTHDWNYTLPNLLEILDGLLESDSSPKPGNGPKMSVNKPIFDLKYPMKLSTLVRSFNASGFKSIDDFAIPVLDSTPQVDAATEVVVLSANDSFVTLDNEFAFPGNESGNSTTGLIVPGGLNTAAMIVTSILLGILILCTVVGNVFVIAAILLERNLQQVANFLIVSLAVADLMVACLVMPLGAVYEISQGWVLGPELCDMWTSSDVLCCTASILHLVAIALDRYWAVTNVDYVHNRNGTRIGIMILLVWLTAVVVSIAPLFGWKDPNFLTRVNEQKKCLVSQDLAYQIFATMSTFYVPLTIILFLYWRIFQTARKRIHKRPGRCEIKPKPKRKRSQTIIISKPNGLMEDGASQQQTTAFITNASGEATTTTVSNSPTKLTNNGAVSTSHITDVTSLPTEQPKKSKKDSIETKREKKAAKTLAIITGAFVVCWLPFFVTALLLPMCPQCWMSDWLFSIFLWLGYFNSTLNPIIYTIFSPEFRQAFKRILCGRKYQRYRPGKSR